MGRARFVLAFSLLLVACASEKDKSFEAPSLASSGKPWAQPDPDLPWARDAGGVDAGVGAAASFDGETVYPPAGEDWPTWGFVPRRPLAFGALEIESGELHVEALDAYHDDGAVTPLLDAPMRFAQATGNREYRPLAELPDDVAALHVRGFFRSEELTVDLPWDAVVLGDFSRSSEALLYLPDPPPSGRTPLPCVQLQTLGTLPVIDDNGIWIRGGRGDADVVQALLADQAAQGELEELTGTLFDLPLCTEPVHAFAMLTKLPTAPVEGNPEPCAPACGFGQVCIDAVCATDAALRITARWDTFESTLEMLLELPGGERLGHRFENEGGFFERVYSAGGALLELESSAAGNVESIIDEVPVAGVYRLRLENSNAFGETSYLGSSAATTYQVDVIAYGRPIQTITGTLPDATDAISIEHVIDFPDGP